MTVFQLYSEVSALFSLDLSQLSYEKKKSLHELPNSTSNINDIHEAYFHFENKRHVIEESTHVNQGRKGKV